MVAPIDAKTVVEVEGETIILRLNFRTLALAKKAGVNLLSGFEMDPLDLATAVRCLAAADHATMTDEDAFALVLRHSETMAGALTKLFGEFGGKAGAEGNGKPNRKPKK